VPLTTCRRGSQIVGNANTAGQCNLHRAPSFVARLGKSLVFGFLFPVIIIFPFFFLCSFDLWMIFGFPFPLDS
jgi:hypothetical protein